MSFIGSLFGSNASGIANQELSGQQAINNAGLQNTQNIQSGLNAQLANANGVGNQSQVYGQQQQLASQLQNLANGQGPNPALAQLAQTTGQNVANQSALMAGQRGAGANAGLIARQAAQQGAATQQQAVGQAATQEANQQLGALGALQNQQALLGQTAASQIGEQQTGINSLNQQQMGQAGLTMQQNQLNLGAQENAQKIQQDQLGSALGALGFPGSSGSGGGGGAAGALSSAASLLAANGGMVQMYAEGGTIHQGGPEVALKENYKGSSKIGKRMHMYAKGGKAASVPALVSPGEKIIPRDELPKVLKGKKSPIEAGKTVPGKAKVPGAKNSYANDTVPKTLKDGDIVLPRSVTQSKHPHWAAKKFIETIMAKKGK